MPDSLSDGPRPAARKSTVLVTGASRGIGRELARLFARDGFHVVLTARDAERLAAVAQELRDAHGASITVIPADLSGRPGVEHLLGALRQRDLEIDVLVNNAGFGGAGAFAATDLDHELSMIAVNVDAVVMLTKRVLPGMLARGRGRILNVASTAAFQPGPWQAIYFATKAFVLAFSEALAEELRASGVTVTAVCPGPTRTEFSIRAHFSDAALGGFVMEAQPVAQAAYEGTLAGRPLVIPGMVNKFHAQAVRVMPRRLLARLAGAVQRRRLPVDD